jgi:hypothetical protein
MICLVRSHSAPAASESRRALAHYGWMQSRTVAPCLPSQNRNAGCRRVRWNNRLGSGSLSCCRSGTRQPVLMPKFREVSWRDKSHVRQSRRATERTCSLQPNNLRPLWSRLALNEMTARPCIPTTDNSTIFDCFTSMSRPFGTKQIRSPTCQKLTSDTEVNVFVTIPIDQLRDETTLRVRELERFVIARDCRRAPVRVPEISPTVGTVAVIDHDVCDRLHPISKQARQH